MTLDDDNISNREAMARQHEADLARRYEDHLEREILESEDTLVRLWIHRMERSAAERPEVHYDERPGVDRRLHGWREAIADGEIPDPEAGEP